MSKLPKWNDRVESFCMSFHGQRIKVASSKNFVFGTNQGKTTEAKNSPVLQFGKQTDNGKRFALDFRYPMAPVQAFAIFLHGAPCNEIQVHFLTLLSEQIFATTSGIVE